MKGFNMSALDAKIEAAEQRLKQLKEQAKKRKQAEAAKSRAKARKDDTRRKILIGSMYLDNIKENGENKNRLLTALDNYLTRDDDRALFDLPASPKTNNQ